MHPADIKAALMKAGYSQTDVARECSVTPTSVSDVINGRSRSKRIENRISIILRAPKGDLWPQWYGPDGKPITRWRRSQGRTGLDALDAINAVFGTAA
jgi:lambda repressor-like predicted transcriptional regulator